MGPIRGKVCAICGERVFTPHAEAQAVCGDCGVAAPPFVRAIAYGSYDGGLRELIHLLKYGRVRPAARVLGRMLAEAVQGFAGEFASAVVVPVPLHSSKLRLGARVLNRRRATESQTGLSDHQRRQNVRGAFVVTSPEEIAGEDVLLVDDVFTTGATVAECTRVLRPRGRGPRFCGDGGEGPRG